MKKLVFTHTDIIAINSAATVSPGYVHAGDMTVNQFLSMDLKTFKSAEGKKLKWTQRIALGSFQKNLAKKVKKGKVDGQASLHDVTKAPSANKFGLMATIFSSVGLLLMFTPVGLLGMALGIAGFVLGLIGLKRDADMTLSLIGVVIGGLVILITVLAVIIVASWLAWY